MKQKIVIKMNLTCEKCRSKAMQLVAAASGVQSVRISGSDRNQLDVVGEGVDPTYLTVTLRKKVGPAHIVEVGEVKEKPKQMERTTPVVCAQQSYPIYSRPSVVYEYPPCDSDMARCSIL